MGKAKITITMNESLIETLNRFSIERKISRSQLVEKAVIDWKRHEMEQELIEGYKAMAEEDKKTAENNFAAGFEAMK